MILKNKVAVITGFSSGIGKTTAILFAKEGAKIVVNSRKNVRGGKAVVKKIIKAGGEAIYVKADVSDPKQAKKLFRETMKHFKTVDILINNAGEVTGEDTLKATRKGLQRAFNDNFYTTVFCSQEAAKIMLKNGRGKILNNASVYGLDLGGRTPLIAYSAAKAAVINFTKTFAKDLAPKVNVNAVAPGYTKTSRWTEIEKRTIKKRIDSTFLKRWVLPEDIAKAFLYLATADADTGEVLVVDAGFSLKRV